MEQELRILLTSIKESQEKSTGINEKVLDDLDEIKLNIKNIELKVTDINNTSIRHELRIENLENQIKTEKENMSKHIDDKIKIAISGVSIKFYIAAISALVTSIGFALMTIKDLIK